MAVVSGTFTAPGQSAAVIPAIAAGKDQRSFFNIDLSGFGTAIVDLERSFDGGATWNAIKQYTADASEVGEEPEAGVQYRFNATSVTASTIAYRLSTN